MLALTVLCVIILHLILFLLFSFFFYSILQMYIAALVHLPFPVEADKLSSLLPSNEQQKLRTYTLEFLLYIILLPYRSVY